MNKRNIANRFGLIALMSLSLFASTAFAGNTPAPTQVVVANITAQPGQGHVSLAQNHRCDPVSAFG